VLKPLDRDPDRYLAVARATDESASDQLLTEREAQVRAQVRDVVAAEVAPRAADVDAAHTFAHDSYQALAAAGLAGLIFPRRWGGTEDTHVAYAVWVAGSEELASRYIPGLLDGTRYGSLAITEPDAGSDVASLKTRATPDGGGAGASYTVTGSKTFITTGDRADVIVCFATVDPALGRRGVTALAVDGAAAGLTRGRPFLKMGMHGSSTAELFFSDVRVPAGNRIGAEGDGWRIVMASVVKSRISAAAQGVGIARAAYTRALLALHQMHGRKLPDEATFALADLRGDILRGRLLLLSIAREVDRSSSPSPGQIGIMKQSCTDLGWRASIEAARILGPFGDLADLGVERCLRDAKVTQIYDGTNEVQRMLIGRDTTRALGELL